MQRRTSRGGWAGRGGTPAPRGRRRTGLPLLLLFVLVLLAGAGAPVPAAAQEAEDAAVAPLLGELDRAWTQRDVAGVLALFAPDGVIQIDPENAKGPDVYRAGGGQSLGVGVPLLMGAATDRIDVAGRQTAAIVFQEAPATLVRWGYQQVGQVGLRGPAVRLPPLPPVTGTDELVIRAGRIARYTRTPDPASVEAWRRVLNAAAQAQARQPIADSRPAPTDTQARSTPSIGPWLAALGFSLVAIVLLALLKRPTEAP